MKTFTSKLPIMLGTQHRVARTRADDKLREAIHRAAQERWIASLRSHDEKQQ